MTEASDEEIAQAIEGETEKVEAAAADVLRALRDDDVALTDEKVSSLWVASDAITALSRSLTRRVPEAHRVDQEGEKEL